MLRAAKNAPGEWVVWRLVHSALKKHFSAIHIRDFGHGEHRTITEGTEITNPSVAIRPSRDLRVQTPLPTIFYVNHSAWWDGHLCMALARFGLHCEPYLMMEEKNLARYRFFTWAGAFGVDRDDVRAALASLDYAAGLLRPSPRSKLLPGMFVFPQGTITPNDLRPLRLYSGAARLALRVAAHQPIRLVPVALRYEFLQEQRPEAFISVGPGIVVGDTGDQGGSSLPTPKILTTALTTALTAELDALHNDVTAEQFTGFATVLRGSRGIDRIFDQATSRGRRQSRRLSQ